MHKELLWMSISIPYDKVDHAGGKTHNFYIKKVHAVQQFHVKLISFCEKKDLGKSDLDKYGLDADICYLDQNSWSTFVKKVYNSVSILNPFTKYANVISNYRVHECLKRIKYLNKTGYRPDIVILQWTSLGILQQKIRKYFPNAKFIVIEEDVTFQNYERRYLLERFIIQKIFYKIRFQNLKKKELHSLNMADLVFVNNKKDYNLLIENNIEKSKIKVLVPYYDQYFHVNRSANTPYKDLLFYGAMSRRENYLSAIWFIQNVFSKIEDSTVRFIIVGSRPHKSLKKFESERIIITGFVKDVSTYFEKSTCMVVPLLYGAGIKVKVLEGFSSGIPILTNHIGIEGIGGCSGKEYYHCESAQEYINAIEQIINNRKTAQQIGENGRKFVKEQFDYYNYSNTMTDILKEM